MRPDMYELIIERPRRNSGDRRPRPRVDLLNEERPPPLRESTSRHRGGTRSLNENLAPLRRYLHRQVGRHWNKVFSEISAWITAGNPVQSHIRQHLEDFIAVKVVERGGELYRSRSWGFHAICGWGRPMLYVCPRTGLVRLARCRRRETPELMPLARLVDDETAFIELDGAWFELRLASVVGRPEAFDVVLRVEVGSLKRGELLARTYGRSDLHAVSKRQLSSREIRKRGLRDG